MGVCGSVSRQRSGNIPLHENHHHTSTTSPTTNVLWTKVEQLPTDIVRCICKDWIALRSLGLLDTAVCSTELRKTFLESVQNQNSKYMNPQKYGNISFIKWLKLRGLIVDNVTLTSSDCVTELSNCEFIAKQLTMVSFNKNAVTIEGLRCITRACTQLTSIDMSNTCMDDLALILIANDCKNLHKLNLNYTDVTYVGVLMVAEACKRLDSLSILSVQLSHNFFELLSNACPQLRALTTNTISRNQFHDLETLCKKCKYLTELNGTEDLTTDLSLILATYCRNLTKLNICQFEPDIPAIIGVLTHCTAIKTLKFGCRGHGGAQGISYFAQYLGNITSLQFALPIGTLAEQNIHDICIYCKSLIELRIVNGYTLQVESILSVLNSVKTLKTLTIPNNRHLSVDCRLLIEMLHAGRVVYTKH